MRKTLDVLKALTLLVICMVGASVFVLLLQISSAVKHADAALASSFAQLNGAIAQAQRTAELSGKLVNDARLSVDNLNKAAIDERFYFERELPPMLIRSQAILANLEKATADLDPLLSETTRRTQDLAPIEANAAQLLADADSVARDPHIAASLENIDVATARIGEASREAATTMSSVEQMAADGQEMVHKFTHPKPIASIANWTLKVVHALGGWF